ncbi:MFS transporter [Cellulomonas sp. SG140]|uniref:MFS transporter n=1 Tax=Cellulomonas sp. SG140 TaxID=2976536 RepID=UPI0021E88B68|nr:MFS transporter [Cellulomonas sp. SG140]
MTGAGATRQHPVVRAAAARRTVLLLTATRWFPVGLTIGVTTLLTLQRGMSVAQLGVILSMQGFVVLGLELPTGGLADAVGRRPVLLAASLVGVASGLVFINARTFGAFVVALALQGVFRALDSGPLEAWYVDTARADDPDVRVEPTLAHAGMVLGVSIAVGALLSGGLVAWHPVASMPALALPYWLALGFQVVNVVAIAVRMHEHRPHGAAAGRRSRVRDALRSAAGAPRTVLNGVRVMAASPVLRALVLVEVFWAMAMIGFETLFPVRLSELAGGQTRAGALMGPVSAAAWGLFAVGSALAARASLRIGVAWTALLARVLNGALVVLMGLMAGPIGLVTAFLLTYTVHGAAGPMHSTLLHREAGTGTRTTVLSMNSMVSGGAYTLGLLVLGPLAEHSGTPTAIVVAGAFSILGAALYWPALRHERATHASTQVTTTAPADV